MFVQNVLVATLLTLFSLLASHQGYSRSEGFNPGLTVLPQFNSPAHEPTIEISGKDGGAMVLVPAGEFTWGGSDQIPRPQRRIYLDAFYLDKFEVTVSQYSKFLASSDRRHPNRWSESNLGIDADRPVIGVTWYDAHEYCSWADKRLPTDAEWEKAARGTDGREYPWGQEVPTQKHANFDKRDDWWKGYSTLAKVGSYALDISPYGIYDLAGNVEEWVADWIDIEGQYYKTDLSRNPTGPMLGQFRVLRGGSWFTPATGLPIRIPSWSDPSLTNFSIGFRCAQDFTK